MKLKNFRRVAALGMAVGMTAVLAACGNTADTAASSEAAESTVETADTAEKASAETRTPSTPIWLISAFPMRLTRTVISRA